MKHDNIQLKHENEILKTQIESLKLKHENELLKCELTKKSKSHELISEELRKAMAMIRDGLFKEGL